METVKILQKTCKYDTKDLFLPEPLESADLMPSLSPQVVYFLQTKIFPCIVRCNHQKSGNLH